MRIGKIAVIIAGLCLALSFGRWSIGQQSDPAVRIAGAISLGDAPTLIAEAQGFFEQQGLDTTTAYHASGKDSIARLRAGKADFALSALTPVVLDRLADPTPGGTEDPVILASLVYSNDLLQIVTAAGSGIEGPSDFAGKRIAVDRGTNTEFVWWLYEQYHRLDRASVELVDLTFPEMPDALAGGRVDAAVLWEPWVSGLNAREPAGSQASKGHIHLRELYVGNWVLVTRRQTAHDNPALCRKILKAYQQAIDFIANEPERAVAVYRDRVAAGEAIDAHHWNALDYELSLDWSLIAGLQEQLHWAAQAGYRTTTGPVHVLELIEPGPLQAALPGAIGIPKTGSDQERR